MVSATAWKLPLMAFSISFALSVTGPLARLSSDFAMASSAASNGAMSALMVTVASAMEFTF